MAKTQHRSLRGKVVDMDQLAKRNELTPAVGNARVNARGDELGPGGKIIKSRDEVVKDYYDSNVAQSSGAAKSASTPVADIPEPTTKPKKTAKKTKKPELSAEEEKMFEEFDDEWVEDADGNFVPKK